MDEEGDKASVNIAKILSEPSFAFSLVGLTSIHRRIFDGVFKFAGYLRQVELSKKELELGGNTSVSYQPAIDLREAIEYDLSREKEFDYSNRPMAEIIKHLSWYFRNALVRASYKGLNITPTIKFVERFLRNVILGEKNELRNRDMLVGASLPASTAQSITPDISTSQFDTLDCALEELAVLRAIEGNSQITQTEIAKSIKKSALTVKRMTSAIVDKGIIIR